MKELEEKIFTAIGEASMCWSETPKGIFDSTKAEKISENLINDIHTIYNPMQTIIESIKTDPEMYEGWQSSIAMSFKSLVQYNQMVDNTMVTVFDQELVHNLANQAAKNFLNLLCDIKEKENDTSHLSNK